jgi:hypothetical protein
MAESAGIVVSCELSSVGAGFRGRRLFREGIGDRP